MLQPAIIKNLFFYITYKTLSKIQAYESKIQKNLSAFASFTFFEQNYFNQPVSFYYVYYVPSFCTLNMYLNVAVCRSLKCCGLYSDMNELLQILLHRISGVLYPIKHYSYEFVLIFCIETYLYPCSDSLSICMWKITCCYTYFFRRFTSVLSKIF